MKRKLWIVCTVWMIMILAACGTGGAKEAPTEKNETAETKETEKTLETSENIVATTTALADIMDRLELDLVGVPTSYKELPERYADVTEVGNPMDPDAEIILSLKPDAVYGASNIDEDVQKKFDQFNVPVSILDFDSVEGMFNEIETLGDKYDRKEQAEALVTSFEEKLAEIEATVADKEKPKVLILMGIPGSYIVGTENSYIGDLVKRAGGENAVTDREEDYIAANTEYLQQTEADIILRAAHGAPAEVVKMFDKEFAENDIWKHFKAVKEDRVYDLEEALFGITANLAATEALDELINILYEE